MPGARFASAAEGGQPSARLPRLMVGGQRPPTTYEAADGSELPMLVPVEFVRPWNPPTLIQHGTDDEVAPIGQVRRFRDVKVRAGNDCILLEY